jgi:two-component system, cell cycle sensor histidine kinase and response regulator CckA
MADHRGLMSGVSDEGNNALSLEERLRQSQAAFHLLFTNNPQPMWVFNLESLQFLDVNAAAISLYGYSREEFLQMRITDIRPPEEVPRLLHEIAHLPAQLNHSGIWQHRLKNGQLREMEITSHSLVFHGQNACLVTTHDVTDRRRTEEALRQAEQKYRQIFEQAIVGIYQSTPQGRFLSVNPAMATMLGYDSPDDLLASITDIQQQLYVDPSHREEFKRLLEEEGVAQHFECEFRRKDGSHMWIATNVRAIRENGKVVRYEGTQEDISERKLLEGQLQQAQKMEAVGLLAGGVAHDFNNALGVIAGYSDLLQMHLPEGDPLHRYPEEIAKAANRAATLTRQLLAFSRKQVIQPVILNLNAIVADMEKMLRRLIGEHIEITIAPGSNLAPVKADPGQIEQILMNLAVNARDAMPQGGSLLIRTVNAHLDETYARQYAYVKPGAYVTLRFSDTGHGMDKSTQARIFEPFFTTKEAGKGTGLGLSTVYGIVKQNNGYIQVYSEVGKGTTFTIYLPQAAGAAESLKPTRGETTLPRGSATVMLVEDEEALRTLARNCLETYGYTVIEVADSRIAMTLAEQHSGPIQLLLTDVIMPGLNGKDLAAHLTRRRPEMKVLYMSGYANDLIAQFDVLDPDTLLLEKPFTLQGLLTKVQQALHTPGQSKAAKAK